MLIGLTELESGFRRDIGLFALHDSDLTRQLIQALSIENREYLQLVEKCSRNMLSSIHLYEQSNLKASRKQILPIIQKMLDT